MADELYGGGQKSLSESKNVSTEAKCPFTQEKNVSAEETSIGGPNHLNLAASSTSISIIGPNGRGVDYGQRFKSPRPKCPLIMTCDAGE